MRKWFIENEITKNSFIQSWKKEGTQNDCKLQDVQFTFSELDLSESYLSIQTLII